MQGYSSLSYSVHAQTSRLHTTLGSVACIDDQPQHPLILTNMYSPVMGRIDVSQTGVSGCVDYYADFLPPSFSFQTALAAKFQLHVYFVVSE